MNPGFRRWWRLLDDLPRDLTRVTVWSDGARASLLVNGHLHVAPSVVACLDGVLRVVSADHTIDLVAGEALVIGAGVWHRHEPLRRGSCWFGQEFLPAFSVISLTAHDQAWQGRLPSHPCRRLIDGVLRAANDGERLAAFRAHLGQALVERVDDLHWDNPAFQRMVTRLHTSLHRGVRAHDLVRVSHLSRAQAYRVFKEAYGVALKDAIDLGRLWLAEALLEQGLSVTAVAERSGWPSADTFARSWKRHHGFPPSLRQPGVPPSGNDDVVSVDHTISALSQRFAGAAS